MEELNVTSLTIDIKDAVLKHFEDIQHDPNVHDVTMKTVKHVKEHKC